MDLDAARKLRAGDPIVAVEDGLSDGIKYHKGQRGTVAAKDHPDSPFFTLLLDTGERTGHVLVGNWECLET